MYAPEVDLPEPPDAAGTDPELQATVSGLACQIHHVEELRSGLRRGDGDR